MNEVLSIILNPINYIIPFIGITIYLWVFVKWQQKRNRYVSFLMRNINNKELRNKLDIKLAFKKELEGVEK